MKMSLRFSEKQIDDLIRNKTTSQVEHLREEWEKVMSSYPKKKRNKYNSRRVEIDGFKFHSIAEGEYYKKLVLRKKAGEIKTFFMQVPIYLGKANRYIVDFMVIENDGRASYDDVKGYETALFKLKRNIIEEVHGIKINVIFSKKKGG